MEKRPEPSNLEVALDARAKGIVAVPCHPLTKVPMVRWKEWQSGELPPVSLIEEWFSDLRRNVAILTTGMALFDCDDQALAELVIRECGETSHKLKSPRGGVHLGYRKRRGVALTNRVRVGGRPLDIRTDGGVEVIPPSRTEDGEYSWLSEGLKPISELPYGNVGWTRTRTRKRTAQALSPGGSPDFMEYRARRWLEAVVRGGDAHPRSINSGDPGDNAAFRASCKLIHSFGLGREAALRLMLTIYGPACEPPWDPASIEHKVDSAIERGHAPS